MRAELSPEAMFLQENSLRVALEDQAQQVLLRYLAGDQNPQTKSDFDAGSQYMEAAMQLTPESLYLQGRDSFFMGRALLFQKQFGRAADLLEALRPHRSGRGLRIQRSWHRVSGTGGFRESDSRVSRCGEACAELVLSAAQPRASLCRSGRSRRGDPQLSAGDENYAELRLSAL